MDEKILDDRQTVPLHHLARPKDNKYNIQIVKNVKYIYVLSSVIWTGLIYVFNFFESDAIGWIFLLIPYFVFGINISQANKCTIDVEDDMFQTNFLSFGYLIVLFLINWEKVKFKKKLFTILMVVLILILFSVFDVWVTKKKMVHVKHIRSILQTLALSLLAYALYIYYEGIIFKNDIATHNN
jgi:hypothetical protein